MNRPPEIETALAKLRDRFAATSGNTLQAFSTLADQLHRNPSAPEVVEALRRELHRVHGTAGSYGFHEVSRLAAALEIVANRWQTDATRDRDRRADIIRQFVRSLEAAFRGVSEASADGYTHKFLLVDIGEELAAPLIAEAVHRGHAIERTTSGGLQQVLDQYLPEVVLAMGPMAPVVPEGVPVVLLSDGEGPSASMGGRVRVIDAGLEPRELLQIAESMAAQTGMAGATMLVVDDDPAMLQLVRSIGEAEGMFVRTATSAERLIEELEEAPPALLLLDAQMPGVDGVAATRRVRKHKRFADLPILLVSASLDAQVRAAAFAAGADDFQPKPVVAVELMRRIGRLIELRRQRQVARGIHPATSLWLPERTIRVFDEAVTAASQDGRTVSVAVIRPRNPPVGVRGAAAWHRECAQLAAALGEDVLCGFIDETSVAAFMPMDAMAASARLEPLARAATGDTVWCGGIAEQPAGAERGARTLSHLAEEAWQAARDGNEHVHRWDTADAGIAPDVIVVEDDPALADLLGYALTSRGLTHQVYTKGPDALAGLLSLKVHDRRPVVLMDVDLPGLDGFSLFERLRQERPRDFRVVFLSVHASEGDQLRALRAGALDYIVKPVSLRVLMAKVAVWRAQDDG